MFERHLSKFCRILLLAVSLLFVGGSLQSCRDWLDEYKYDDSEPDWLGASIYAFLQEGTANCSYKNYVELIDSLGEQETLAHTGSKTLFVADDAAFARFFANNPWGVSSVSEMTKSQMKLILYGSMLNNSLLIDMMANTGSNEADEGLCLRRVTSLNKLDTVPLVDRNFFENHLSWPTYNIYWDAVRGKGRMDTLRLAMDGSTPMMVHFLGDYLRRNGISEDDVNFLFAKNGASVKGYADGEVMIYGNKVLGSDVDYGEFSDDTLTIACKNGYVYRIDEVLVPPTNMAGELRARRDLRIFSHLLDRFCFPVYDAALSKEYLERTEKNDSIFALRYFSNTFSGHSSLNNITLLPSELLNYDPGKNNYASNLGLQSDMAAMFVPMDNVLYEYFSNGAGYFLLERYAPDVKVPSDYAEENVAVLLQALDSVPQLNIAPFLNNLMKPSFVNTVASKFERITNDANDDMGLRREHVDECIIANNGVVYLLNKVFAPAAYSAVTAPTLVNDNMIIMRNIIKQLRYDYYLLAMDANYTLIVPEDGNFRYYDPVSFVSPNTPKLYEFRYDNTRAKNNNKNTEEFWAKVYDINSTDLNLKLDTLDEISKSEQGPYSITGSNFGNNSFLVNRMTDLMDYLIIVHDNEDTKPYIHADKKYYLTKGYGTIKIDADDAGNIKFYGGEQLETNTVVVASEYKQQENGRTYCTAPENQNEEMRLYSSVPTPARRNIYDNMKVYASESDDLYYEFYKMCYPDGVNLRDWYEKIVPDGYKGLNSTKLKEAREDSVRIYSVFYTTQDKSSATKIVNGVPFLNTYHYTVYIPSNDAVKELYNSGFPQWSHIKEQFTAKNYGRVASLIRLMNSVVRTHFQDNSVFLDESDFEVFTPDGNKSKVVSYATGVINPQTGRFYENTVKSGDDGKGGRTILVKDPLVSYRETNEAGFVASETDWAKVDNSGEENVTWNVMCRDIVYRMSGETPKDIETSSFSVLQPIDRVLLVPSLYGYDGRFVRFATTGEQVDTMFVAGGKEGQAGSDKNGNKFSDDCYLVARCGKTNVVLPDGTIEKNEKGKDKLHEIAYLMKPKTSGQVLNIEEEEFVTGVDRTPWIITRDGYLVKIETDEDGNKYYAYDTIKDDAGNLCRKKVNNKGGIIGKEPFGTDVQDPENGDDNVSGN